MRNRLSSPILCKAVSAEFERSIAIGEATQHAFARVNGFSYQAPAVRVELLLVLRNEPIARGGGKPHVREELYRFGGETVYVSPGAPNGLTDEQYKALSEGE